MASKVRKKKHSAIQKRILKRLIDADLNMAAAARINGHIPQNASLHFLRENESYFDDAIRKYKEDADCRNAAVSSKSAEVSA